MNKEQQRLKDKRKFKDDILDGYKEMVVDASEVMCERKLFWFEVKND